MVNKYIKDEETYTLLDAALRHVVDAMDTLSPKLALIAAALEQGRTALVSSMRLEPETDPTELEIADIEPTTARWPTCSASGSTKSASAGASGRLLAQPMREGR